MHTPEQEIHWVLRAQCHDREALESLLRAIQPSLSRYIRGLVGALHADDITQEVMVTVCRKIGWLQQAELFRPWMFRIATRTAFRHVKRERRWSDYLRDDEALERLPATAERPPDERLQELLALDDLSPASRAVLVLHFQEDMTLADVAAILEIPIGTAKSRLAYGLAKLRKHVIRSES